MSNPSHNPKPSRDWGLWWLAAFFLLPAIFGFLNGVLGGRPLH